MLIGSAVLVERPDDHAAAEQRFEQLAARRPARAAKRKFVAESCTVKPSSLKAARDEAFRASRRVQAATERRTNAASLSASTRGALGRR